MTPRRKSAKLARSRFGVAITRNQAKEIVTSLAQATAEAKHHDKTVSSKRNQELSFS